MADSKGNKQNRRPAEQEPSPATLLPMLIGGLVLIVIGMVVVTIFA